MGPELFSLWVPLFALTLLLELPVYLLALTPRVGWLRALGISLGLQALTHPALWLIWSQAPGYFNARYTLWVWVFEILIVAVEALALGWVLGALPPSRRPSWPWVFFWAAVANAFSVAMGRWLSPLVLAALAA